MLEISGLHYQYPASQLPVITNLNIVFQNSTVTTLIGHSGGGKTTLANLVCGYLQPSAGTIALDGCVVNGKPSRRILQISQDNDLFPWQTCEKHLTFVSPELSDEKLNDLLSEFGLYEAKRSYPAQLSGGMRKRLSLARVLIQDPRVLIIDEAFSSLDTETREQIMTFLSNYWSNRDTIVINISHNRCDSQFLGGYEINLDEHRRILGGVCV